MHRRDALQRIGLVAAVASTSGCAAIIEGGPDRKPRDGDRKRSGNLESTNIIPPYEDEDGNVVVGVTITNNGDEQASATLEASLEIGESVHEKSTTVTVPGGESKDVTITYDLDFETYENADTKGIDFNLV
ncbi:hypothetical protein [Halomicrococcus gelatinilyticus]|uniref:hypothetical protein n=1 Tax=Halomicrococcus gelatinilyticus TaxID=1702103 RepID=UPI002E0F2308